VAKELGMLLAKILLSASFVGCWLVVSAFGFDPVVIDAISSPGSNTKHTKQHISPIPEELLEDPVFRLSTVCDDLGRELKEARSCDVDLECGKVIAGTSCGCTRNLIARKDADMTKLNRLINQYLALASVSLEWPTECRQVEFASSCDCPEAIGFACKDHLCTWNYLEAEPWMQQTEPPNLTLSPNFHP